MPILVDKESSVKSSGKHDIWKPSHSSSVNDINDSDHHNYVNKEDPTKVAKEVLESVNSTFPNLILYNPQTALETTIKLAVKGLSFAQSLEILLKHAPTSSEDELDNFREIFDQLAALGNDIRDTKKGLVKEMEDCARKEEMIRTRIIEEQNRKVFAQI